MSPRSALALGTLLAAMLVACAASASTEGADQARRLTTSLWDYSFEGKLKCKIDPAAPLNVTDFNQPFIMSCDEIKPPYNYLWVYIVVGVIGGGIGLIVLAVVAVFIVDWIKGPNRPQQEKLDQAAAQNKSQAFDLSSPV